MHRLLRGPLLLLHVRVFAVLLLLLLLLLLLRGLNTRYVIHSK